MRDVDAATHGAGKHRTPEENRVAMLAALHEVEAAGGGTVFLPAGVYSTVGGIEKPANVKLIGRF